MMRPRRKRKLTNYGEGHLHWIEESQIHKALMKSLREKKYHGTSDPEESTEQNPSSSNKMPRLSVSVSHSSDKEEENNYLGCSVNIEKIHDKLSSNLKSLASSSSTDPTKRKKTTRFQNVRSSKRMTQSQKRNQVEEEQNPCLHPHAAMMQSRNSDKSGSFNVKECGVALSKKKGGQKKQNTSSEEVAPPQNGEDTTMQAPKARAQRKFASNVASPSKTKSNSSSRKKVQNLEPSLPQNDETLPNTADFLTFLCFRNTPLHEKLNLSEFKLDNEKNNKTL